MKHLSEEQLILHYYGETDLDGLTAPEFDQHLAGCADCRASYSALQLVLNTVDSAPVPERGADYGAQVWRRVQPKLPRRLQWRALLQPRWWVLVPTAAMLMLVAFFAGRVSQKKTGPPVVAGNQVRERILLVAVGDHLDRSQMVLAELSNAPEGKGNGKVDISSEQQIAGELLDDNRLYRQTAHSAGETLVASVLEDLERVLMEIAHSPSEVSANQLEQLRQEIRERGLLFRIRVVDSQVKQRETQPKTAQPRTQPSGA